jgi:hypothetical protein
MMSFISRYRVARIAACALAILVAGGCGGHNHLSEYSFASRSLALVYIAPPHPELLTGWYDVSGVTDAVSAVVTAGSGVAKEVSGRRARARLDSATSLVDVSGLISRRTLERTSRYLGTTQTANPRNADYVLEVNMHNSGIDIRGHNRVPTGAITAGVLNTVSVADFQRALEQLADFSSNEITDRLREALRDVRQSGGGR